jgi:CDP-diacylglycerol--glycerol-3-phosphate 3-phosphatidyltransferase
MIEPQTTPNQPAQGHAESASIPHVHDDMTFNTTPNQLTMLRIVFVPIVIGFLYLRTPTWDVVAALCFSVAGATDWFDGYIARTQKVVTVYGKLLDPLADKFLTVCCLVMLQDLGRVPAIVVMILICRELAITGLRALASAEGVIIAASQSAKWKTATQMVAIGFLMVKPGIFGIPMYQLGLGLLYISLGISLWSAKDYIVDFFRALKEQRKTKVHERRIARQARLLARAERMAAKARRGT